MGEKHKKKECSKELTNSIVEKKKDTVEQNIDYEKIENAIDAALNKTKTNEDKIIIFMKYLMSFMLKIVLPISALAIAILSYCTSSNNSSLVYEYTAEAIKGKSNLYDNKMPFEVNGKTENYTLIPLNIKLRLKAGTIKSIYTVYENYDGNLEYDKLQMDGLKKEMFKYYPSTDIQKEIYSKSEKEIQSASIWIVLVDNNNNVFVDFYEVIAKSIIKVEDQSVTFDPSYKNEDIILNYRSVKYDNLFESDFLEKTKWHNEEGVKDSTINEDYIIEKTNMIKARFENIYG